MIILCSCYNVLMIFENIFLYTHAGLNSQQKAAAVCFAKPAAQSVAGLQGEQT